MKKVALAALASAALLPLVVSARHVDVTDGNDTKGRFDIKRVETRGGSPYRWRITTWNKWTIKQAWDAGFVLVYLDMFGSDRADYYALVRSNGHELRAALYRDPARKNDYRVRDRLDVAHPSPKVVRVTVPFGDLRRRDSRLFRWRVQTLWTGDECRRVCFDRAPNRTDVAEPGPESSPTIPPASPSIPPKSVS